MSASPATLHLLAHQAQQRARTAQDWWASPLDTALAAASAARHPPAHRPEAELALDRLRRWYREGQPRRISADTTALALAAATAHDLAQRDRDLEEAAVEAVDDLAGRSAVTAPPLHLALSSWALERVVPDRSEAPWPALRARFEHRSAAAHGIDAPLTTLSAALAAERFDGAALVRALLSVPASPSLGDGAVLLWLLTAAIERSAADLDEHDSGLQALSDRRTELAARLAAEVDASVFDHPELDDFDPEAPLDERPVTYLSPMEALLLDLSLASAEPEVPWLRFEEAKALFGRAADDLRRRLAARTAMLLALVGLLAGGVLALALNVAGVDADVAVWAAIALAAGTLLIALAIWLSEGSSPGARAVAALSAGLCVAAAFETLNRALTTPLVKDAASVTVSLIIAVIAAAATTMATRK